MEEDATVEGRRWHWFQKSWEIQWYFTRKAGMGMASAKTPNTLFAKLFKAKYYKDGCVLDWKFQWNQSYGWASILVDLDVIKKGIRYTVGDGKDIKVFQDNWIPTTPPRPASGAPNNNSLFVRDLISFDGTYPVGMMNNWIYISHRKTKFWWYLCLYHRRLNHIRFLGFKQQWWLLGSLRLLFDKEINHGVNYMPS